MVDEKEPESSDALRLFYFTGLAQCVFEETGEVRFGL